MSWASADDVIDSWIGADAPSDADLVRIWIDRAERLLMKKIPNLAVRIDPVLPDVPEPGLLESAVDVVSSMVQRVFRNPQGTRQRQETTGPFTESVTYGGDQPGSLWVTDDELQMLSGLSTGRHTAFSVDLIQGYVFPNDPLDPWVNT